MYQAFLSFRYLRARPINWIGVAGIFVAVSALILILSIMAGFLAESRGHLRGSLADVLIQPHLDRPIEIDGQWRPVGTDAERLCEVALTVPEVAAASPHYTWYGMLAAQRRERMLSDPNVPMSHGHRSVSPMTMSTEVSATSSSSATNWGSDVMAPWPISILPTRQVTRPFAPMCR